MERDMRDRERVETVKADTHDAVDEVKERVKAGGEALKRTVAGGAMNPAEKLGSHLREAGHDLKADAHHATREMRDEATRADDDGI
jgi:hypothetical protein